MTNTNYKTIASKIKFEGRAFINGKYVDAIDGKKFETINPATGETLCSVAKCNSKDVDLAVKVSSHYTFFNIKFIFIFFKTIIFVNTIFKN